MISAAWLLAMMQLASVQDELAACRKIPEGSQRLACYDKLAPAVPEAPTAPAAVPVAPAPPTSPPVPSFGAEALPKEKVHEPDRLQAHLVGKLDGWRKGTQFALDNGQVWLCVDDQEGFSDLDHSAVSIERNRIGTYWMNIEHVNGGIRVRRIQ